MKFSRKQQKGFTLVELVVVLAIIVFSIAAIISRQRSVSQTARVQTESGNLQAIYGKINSIFAARSSYTGVSNDLLKNQGAFPTSMIVGTNVVNGWGGFVDVLPLAPDNTSVNVKYTDVPKSACIEFVLNASKSYRTVTVNTTLVKSSTDAEAKLDDTNTSCTANDTATITFNAAS